MTWRVAIYERDSTTERVHDLPWSTLAFTHVLGGPGAVEIGVSMTAVDRADVEPGQSDYRVYQDSTLRAEGRLWSANPETPNNTLRATLHGKGVASVLTHRLIDWEVRYEPVLESPTNANTAYDMSQEDILWDLLSRTQAEAGGALGITQGAHVGGTKARRRWWCEEDGLVIAQVFDDFAGLANGIDWAITPTLSNAAYRTLLTWNPARGSDLTGSITLNGLVYLDTLAYEIDAEQVVSRGRSVAQGSCDPPKGDYTDATALADYGLLEKFEAAASDHQDDADETAEAQISAKPLVDTDTEYQLSNGPALGAFDIGDTITVVDSTRPGWPLSVAARVQEIGVTVQLPDDDDHTFVRVNWSEVAA